MKRVLCVWGNAEHGRLGLGTTTGGQVWPQICKAIENVKTVVCGGAHTVVLTETGEVWSFGLNSEGQLGHSAKEDSVSTPRRVDLPDAIQSVSAGHLHTLCLTASGQVWAFGSNAYGQLGLGKQSKMQHAEPIRVTEFEGIPIQVQSKVRLSGTDICCGASHSLGRTQSGELYAWGSNYHGQLGQQKKSFLQSRQAYPRLIRESRGQKIRNIAAGHVCSGCVDEDGYIHTWGGNHFWQLGFPADNSTSPIPKKVPSLVPVRKLLFGGCHAMGIMENASVCVWGTNEHGCLGLGPNPRQKTRASDSTLSTERIDDRVPQGDALIEATIPVPVALQGTNLVDGSLGWKHSAGVTAQGDLMIWGWGGSMGAATYLFENHEGPGGQLGHGSDFDSWFPIRVAPPKLPDGRELQFCHVSCGLNHTAAIAQVVQRPE